MRVSQIFVAGMTLCFLAEPVIAKSASDLTGLPICSALKAMPQGYRPLECDVHSPLRGSCRFSLADRAGAVEYLMENGTILDKRMRLKAGVQNKASFGIIRDDGRLAAARKILTSTGLKTRYWTDSEDATTSYLQSTDVNCGPNKSYTIYVWFRNGRAESVSVSTLPVD